MRHRLNALWQRAETVGARQRLLFGGLLLAAAALTLATVYRGLLTEDAAMYALGLLRLDREGLAALPGVFNGELSFGYYSLHLSLFQLYKAPLQVGTILSVVNGLFAVGAIAVYFGLVRRWFGAKIAFFAALLLLLAPGFWQLSRYGHPAMAAVALFLASLAALDRLIASPGGPARRTAAVAFVILAVTAWALRADTLLLGAVYFGLLLWRGRGTRRWVLAVVALLLLALLIYEGLRVAVLGYALNPEGGTVLLHLGRTFQHRSELWRSAIRNLTLWALGVNLAVGAFALLALANTVWGGKRRLAIFALCWLAPIALLVPFHALDFSRIATLATPVVALLAALLPTLLRVRHTGRALVGLVVASQLVAVLVQPLVVSVYPPRMVYQGRHLATVPLGLNLTDTLAKQSYIIERDRIVRQVIQVVDRDVAVMGSSNLMPYRFYLAVERGARMEERTSVAGAPVGVVTTATNRFYLLDADDCPGCEQERAAMVRDLAGRGVAFHVVPFDSRFTAEGLFLTEKEIKVLEGGGL